MPAIGHNKLGAMGTRRGVKVAPDAGAAAPAEDGNRGKTMPFVDPNTEKESVDPWGEGLTPHGRPRHAGGAMINLAERIIAKNRQNWVRESSI